MDDSMGKQYIGFGKLSLNNIYIFLTALMSFLKESLLDIGDLGIQTNVNIFGFKLVIKNHGLMKIILDYFGKIIFGIIFLLKFEKISFFTKREEEIVKNEFIYNEISEEGMNSRTYIYISSLLVEPLQYN